MSKPPKRIWWGERYESYANIAIEKYNWGGIKIWFTDDSDNRSVEMKITFRTYSDLVKHLGFNSVYDLPEELRHYIYTRASAFTGVGWQPNCGNSILNFTDPMNEIKDPWRDHLFCVYLYMSKSYYNKMVKKFGNKRSANLELIEGER